MILGKSNKERIQIFEKQKSISKGLGSNAKVISYQHYTIRPISLEPQMFAPLYLGCD